MKAMGKFLAALGGALILLAALGIGMVSQRYDGANRIIYIVIGTAVMYAGWRLFDYGTGFSRWWKARKGRLVRAATGEELPPPRVKCQGCGQLILEGLETCPWCGWSRETSRDADERQRVLDADERRRVLMHEDRMKQYEDPKLRDLIPKASEFHGWKGSIERIVQIGVLLFGVAVVLCWVGALGEFWDPLFFSFYAAAIVAGVGLLLVIVGGGILLATGGWTGLRSSWAGLGMRMKALRKRKRGLPIEIEMPPFARIAVQSRLSQQENLTPIMESLAGDRLVNGRWPEGEVHPGIPRALRRWAMLGARFKGTGSAMSTTRLHVGSSIRSARPRRGARRWRFRDT
jgi:hypothetical protein